MAMCVDQGVHQLENCMNLKELEALVVEQGRYIQELQKASNADNDWSEKLKARIDGHDEALANITGRIDRQTEGFTAKVEGLQAALSDVLSRLDDVNGILKGVHEEVQQALSDVQRLKEWIGAGDADGPFYAEFVALKAKLEDVAAKVEGRNKSAAVKRNMTDPDALEVLTGKYKGLGHKEAAEEIGLTYAQVYSCRLCFTFKHVHHDLEKGGWKNPWSKTK